MLQYFLLDTVADSFPSAFVFKQAFQTMTLRQPVSAASGDIYFFTFSISASAPGNLPRGNWGPQVDINTDSGDLSYWATFTSEVGDQNIPRRMAYGSGRFVAATSYISLSVFTVFAENVTIYLDDIYLYLYQPSIGSSPLTPVPERIITNADYSFTNYEFGDQFFYPEIGAEQSFTLTASVVLKVPDEATKCYLQWYMYSIDEDGIKLIDQNPLMNGTQPVVVHGKVPAALEGSRGYDRTRFAWACTGSAGSTLDILGMNITVNT